MTRLDQVEARVRWRTANQPALTADVDRLVAVARAAVVLLPALADIEDLDADECEALTTIMAAARPASPVLGVDGYPFEAYNDNSNHPDHDRQGAS